MTLSQNESICDRKSSLTLVTGPMFSGKSSYILNKAREFIKDEKKILLIRHLKDQRHQDLIENFHYYISTHGNDRLRTSTDEDAILGYNQKVEKLEEVVFTNINPDVIIIEEGQFYPDIYNKVVEWLNTSSCKIIVCSLHAYCGTKKEDYIIPLTPILNLIPHAIKHVMLNSTCMNCHANDGIYHKKITNTNQIEEVGGSEIYKVYCRQCMSFYNKNTPDV